MIRAPVWRVCVVDRAALLTWKGPPLCVVWWKWLVELWTAQLVAVTSYQARQHFLRTKVQPLPALLITICQGNKKRRDVLTFMYLSPEYSFEGLVTLNEDFSFDLFKQPCSWNWNENTFSTYISLKISVLLMSLLCPVQTMVIQRVRFSHKCEMSLTCVLVTTSMCLL